MPAWLMKTSRASRRPSGAAAFRVVAEEERDRLAVGEEGQEATRRTGSARSCPEVPVHLLVRPGAPRSGLRPKATAREEPTARPAGSPLADHEAELLVPRGGPEAGQPARVFVLDHEEDAPRSKNSRATRITRAEIWWRPAGRAAPRAALRAARSRATLVAVVGGGREPAGPRRCRPAGRGASPDGARPAGTPGSAPGGQPRQEVGRDLGPRRRAGRPRTARGRASTGRA